MVIHAENDLGIRLPVQDVIPNSPLREGILVELLRGIRRWISIFEVSFDIKAVLVAGGVMLIFWYGFIRPRLQRRRQSRLAIAFKSSTSEDGYSKAEDWVVICRHCGARNPISYRYCHNCINRLPATVRKSWDDDQTSDH
ncbi:DUF7577 domain-containing protein [Halobellus litoreus]|uniref:DUF7577 domain-containing protein n=1 Tax=Halobellus litoreus TaxID=755310 RepID=UPI003CE50CF9